MKMNSDKENKVMMEMHEMMDSINVMPMPGDPDHHFAMMMKMHHEGAIHMAEIVMKDGNDATMKKMAGLVIQKQKQEIAHLQGFLEMHTPGAANEEFNMKMEMCMDKMDSNTNLQKINGNVDHDFAMLMISHHQSAIDMADLIIHYGRNESIQRLAREIKEDQEMEIQELQEWLSEHESV
jgi:uncharacterized protein (DUF305 family)